MLYLPYRKTGKHAEPGMLELARKWADKKKFKILQKAKIQYGYDELNNYSWILIRNPEGQAK